MPALNRNKPLHVHVFNVFYALMSVVYVFTGLFFAFSPAGEKIMEPPLGMYFGLAVSGYGLLRGYRAYRRFRE